MQVKGTKGNLGNLIVEGGDEDFIVGKKKTSLGPSWSDTPHWCYWRQSGQ